MDGDQSARRIRPELSKSHSLKSGKSTSALAAAVRSPERSHDDLDLLFSSKSSISLTASTSMPNLADLNAGVVPDVQFWQDLDLHMDSFDQDAFLDQSPQKSRKLGISSEAFSAASSATKKRPPKVDSKHFYHPHPGKDGVASRTTSAKSMSMSMSMSRENSGSATKSSSSSGNMSLSMSSSASHAKMEHSSASTSDSLNRTNSSISMSMSIDSRDTMSHLARRIEPVLHDNIEFAPLDMTPGEELNLRRSSSYGMLTDERLVQHSSASSNTTPFVQKILDFLPDSISMSMSSWSQHTISHDVFRHHNVVHEGSFKEGSAMDNNEIWPVPSDDLDLLGSLDSYNAGPSLQVPHPPSSAHSSNHNNHNNNSHNGKNLLPPTHSHSNHNINSQSNNARNNTSHTNTESTNHSAPSATGGQPKKTSKNQSAQSTQSAPPAAPAAPKASPKIRAPRGPVRGRGNPKLNVEKSSVSEKQGAKESNPVLSPRSAEKTTPSLPVGDLSNRFGLTIEVPPAPQASPQLTHMPVMMQGMLKMQGMQGGYPAQTAAEGMYSYPTSFPLHPHGPHVLSVHTNSPSSPRDGAKHLSPTHYVGVPVAPLYDPLTGVMYYPQMPNAGGQMSPPGSTVYDPNTHFFVPQMQAIPGISPHAAATGIYPYQGSAYAFPSSYSSASAAEGPNSFETSISATIMNHGSTSTTVTPTGGQTKKDKKEKNRGNYRCGRCGKPKVNHVCAFVDAVTMSQAVQTNSSILNPSTRQPYPTDRIITVNAKRKSIHDDRITAADVETFKSLGMKTASDSFTLGSKTHLNSSSSTALGSLSTKSGGSLLGESLFIRSHSETFDSLSRSCDEGPAYSLEVKLHTVRSPVGSSANQSHLKNSVAFVPPSSQGQSQGHSPEAGLEKNQNPEPLSKPAATPRGVVLGLLSCASDEAEDAFFPTEYPPHSIPRDRDGVDSSRNSSSVASNTGNDSDTSSVNGDIAPAATATRPAKRGSLFPTDLGLSKFFQF